MKIGLARIQLPAMAIQFHINSMPPLLLSATLFLGAYKKMAKKVVCVVLVLALAMVILGVSVAAVNLCDYQQCGSNDDCNAFDTPGNDFNCCEVGQCAAGVGYCCIIR
ncbi:hypothetical protein SUGI_0727120 [Cryptomeria japonica]|nr:hypothetical protein SUGI_0727120 [Cryptomeria japonica]